MKRRIEEWLRDRGAPDHLVDEGLEGLVGAWEQLAIDADTGHILDKFDFLNQVDVRQMLHEIGGFAEFTKDQSSRISLADALYRGATVPQEECVWGDVAAAENEWSPEREWWYYRVPRQVIDA